MSDPAVHDAANGGNEEEKRLGAQATDAEVVGPPR